MEKLQRDMRILKAYVFLVTLVLIVLVIAGFRQSNQKNKFTEIDVERINIVEKDGRLSMVLSNRERQHPGVMDGKSFARKRPPGIIFFNEKGDECGGLAFDGNLKDGRANASALLAFDRFHQDQTVGLQYGESNNQYYAGLRVWDRPDTSLVPVIEKFSELEKITDSKKRSEAMKEAMKDMKEKKIVWGPERVMVGRDRDQAAIVRLSDTNGIPRIKLSVDATGQEKLEFLDEKGSVVYRLPDDNKKNANDH